jgi:hypothetical protein
MFSETLTSTDESTRRQDPEQKHHLVSYVWPCIALPLVQNFRWSACNETLPNSTVPWTTIWKMLLFSSICLFMILMKFCSVNFGYHCEPYLFYYAPAFSREFIVLFMSRFPWWTIHSNIVGVICLCLGLIGCDTNKHVGPCEFVPITASFCCSGDCLKRDGEPLKFGQAFNLCTVENLSGHVSMSLRTIVWYAP